MSLARNAVFVLLVTLGAVVGLPVLYELTFTGSLDAGLWATITGLWGPIFGFLGGLLDWSRALLLGLGIVGVLVLIMGGALLLFFIRITGADTTAESDEDDGPATFSNMVYAAFAGLGLFLIYVFRWDIWAFRRGIGFALLALGLAYIAFVFLQERDQRARTRTAVDQTSRRLGRDVRNWAQVAGGVIVIGASILLGTITGLLDGLGGLDQFLTPLLNEIGYLLLTIVGYAQLGGDFPGAGWIPEMNPLQWVGLALIIGAAVVIFRDN